MLDLFCGAGGAAMGYSRAGFDVIGVDIVRQPRYPFQFVQTDALKFLEALIFVRYNMPDAIHASPPCQRFSDLGKLNGNWEEHPDLITPTRKLLRKTDRPWVIENVEGAPLRQPVKLCGTMFPSELRVIRHRLFETNWPLPQPDHDTRHPRVHTMDKRKSHYGKTDEWEDFVQVTGGGNSSVAAARDAMGIDWMTKAEINEAIPPAYTHYVGFHLMEYIRDRVAA